MHNPRNVQRRNYEELGSTYRFFVPTVLQRVMRVSRADDNLLVGNTTALNLSSESPQTSKWLIHRTGEGTPPPLPNTVQTDGGSNSLASDGPLIIEDSSGRVISPT
jgi:hypothetical protein